MAKIKFGMMMTDASGKLGGQVFSKNRGGSYVRTKTTPSNPQTSAQMAIRGMFAGISSGWSTLTEASRQSFNGFVASYATTDIFGDIRNPSGKALYQKLNQNMAITGQSAITQCISPQEVPFAGVVSASADVSNTSMEVVLSGNTLGSKLIIFATPSLSQGTTFVKNKFRQIAVVDGITGGPVEFYLDYVAKFGTFVGGANIHIAVRVVNTNGQASPLETSKVHVTL